MSAIPAEVETDAGPPMAVPLGHFLAGLFLLLVGGAVGVLGTLGVGPGGLGAAHVHLLVAGWVCLTVLGAMTQFVPVWAGTRLYSRRLAGLQLGLVAGGVTGLAAALAAGAWAAAAAVGVVALLGFWVFVYNVGRTLAGVRPWDVTERHFALALSFFPVVPALGVLLATSYATPLLAGLPVASVGLRSAHATLAVFGAVLTPVVGALYQLGPMFTQSDPHGLDHHLRRLEEVTYPLGVVALATGRLVGLAPLARVGGLLVVVGLLAVAATLTRRLVESRVAWSPMLRRYAVVAGALVAWATGAGLAWWRAPLAPAAVLGAPGGAHLLLVGVVALVVLGTLYHVVPFIVWVNRYSDRLGLEPVPMIDDLYDPRLAGADLLAVGGGGLALVLGAAVGPPWLEAAGGAATLGGFGLAAANLLGVVRTGAGLSPRALLGPESGAGRAGEGAEADSEPETDGPAGSR